MRKILDSRTGKVYTSDMVKKLICLSKPQVELLKQEAQKLGISFSEMLRRILDQWLQDKK